MVRSVVSSIVRLMLRTSLISHVVARPEIVRKADFGRGHAIARCHVCRCLHICCRLHFLIRGCCRRSCAEHGLERLACFLDAGYQKSRWLALNKGAHVTIMINSNEKSAAHSPLS
jgi:hypothetical protein